MTEINAKLLDLLDRAAFMWEKQVGPGYFLTEMQAAIAAARAQMADDATPVDQAWLTSLGWEPIGDHWFPVPRTIQGVIVYWYEPRNELTIAGVWKRSKATRGDVRRLLAGLGIEAK